MTANYDKWKDAIALYNEHLQPLMVEDVADLEKLLKRSLDQQHKEFLLRFGGCFCGVSIYGKYNSELLEEKTIVELTNEFSNQIPDDAYAISFDGSHNPIYIDSHGRVFLFDHDTGEHELLGADFDTFVDDNVLG